MVAKGLLLLSILQCCYRCRAAEQYVRSSVEFSAIDASSCFLLPCHGHGRPSFAFELLDRRQGHRVPLLRLYATLTVHTSIGHLILNADTIFHALGMCVERVIRWRITYHIAVFLTLNKDHGKSASRTIANWFSSMLGRCLWLPRRA